MHAKYLYHIFFWLSRFKEYSRIINNNSIVLGLRSLLYRNHVDGLQFWCEYFWILNTNREHIFRLCAKVYRNCKNFLCCYFWWYLLNVLLDKSTETVYNLRKLLLFEFILREQNRRQIFPYCLELVSLEFCVVLIPPSSLSSDRQLVFTDIVFKWKVFAMNSADNFCIFWSRYESVFFFW